MSLNIAILNMFLPLVIFLYNRRVNRNAVLLSILLFLIATSHVRHALVMHASDPFWLAIIANNLTPIWTLIGPCLYLYVRGVLTDRMEWKRTDWLHTIPFWINLVGIVPYLLTPFSYKLQVADMLIRHLETYKDMRMNWLMPQPVNLTIRSVLQIAYALACMAMLVRYSRRHRSDIDRPRRQSGFVYPWLWAVTVFVLLIAIYYFSIVLLYYYKPELGRRMMFEYEVVYLLGGILTFLPFLLLFVPEILYGIPKYRPLTPVAGTIPGTQVTPPVSASPDSNLTATPASPVEQPQADPFQQLADRIRSLMEQEKPYLRKDFTFDDLARQLEAPRHHVQYCLRHVLQTRFVTLRTRYRIAYAKQRLLEGDNQDTTLEYIGNASGFSSRSAFYKVFKAEVGCSPGEYAEKYRTEAQSSGRAGLKGDDGMHFA